MDMKLVESTIERSTSPTEKENSKKRKYPPLPDASNNNEIEESEKSPSSFQDKAQELKQVLQQARENGLPEGWIVEFESQNRRRVWRYPAKQFKARSLPKAIEQSVKWGLLAKLPERQLTSEEINKLKSHAQKRGLPDGWVPFYDSETQKPMWKYCDDDQLIAASVPKALEKSVELGLKPKQVSSAVSASENTSICSEKSGSKPPKKRIRKRASFDMEKSMETAKAKGLPEKWSCEWNSETNKRRWVAPDNRSFSTLTQALAHVQNVQQGKDRVLTKEEIAEAMKVGKARGLPDGWTVSWDVTNKSKKWHAPNGRIATTLPKAIAMSKKMGLIPADVAEDSASTTEKQTRVLTYEESCAAMADAKARGLPSGWKVEWNDEIGQRRWIAPDGVTACGTIPQALALSVKKGWAKSEDLSEKKQPGDQDPNPAQLEAKLKHAQAKGLGEKWKCLWDTSTQRTKWLSPEGQSFRTLPQALSHQLKSLTQRVLTPEEKEEALAQAQAKGLPPGWTVVWDNNNGSRKWVSPVGSIATSLPKALAISAKMGLLNDKKPSPFRQLTEDEVAAAMLEARNRGLPGGWKVEWCNQQQMRRWISPKSGIKCNSLPLALARSVKEGLLPKGFVVPKGRTKSQAKDVGLPDGWVCVYNEKAKRRKWRSPCGTKLCRSLPEALKVSVELGLLPPNTAIARPRRSSMSTEEAGDMEEATDAANILMTTASANPPRKREWL